MSKCKSCGAEIRWIKTPAGKSMPCDPEPIYFRPDPAGDLQLVTANGSVQRGVRADNRQGARENMEALVGYVSHFATCPNAARHRRR